MKVIIINGSARKGNTLTAIEAFVTGASEKNEIEIIEPDKLNIAPCKGCGVCQCSKAVSYTHLLICSNIQGCRLARFAIIFRFQMQQFPDTCPF